MPETTNATIRLPLLFGGISHQPPHIRAANQVQDAENAVFSVVDGVSKRPGTQWIATISTLPVPPETSGTFSGNVDPPDPPDPPPSPTGPGGTGTGTGGTSPESGGNSGTPGGPDGVCVPGVYASSYVLTGLTVQVYDVVPEFANGPLLDTFNDSITLNQQTNACIWCGLGQSTSLFVTTCMTLDTTRVPPRWHLSIFATVKNQPNPSLRPNHETTASKSGTSPQVTSWNLYNAYSGIGEYGWIIQGTSINVA